MQDQDPIIHKAAIIPEEYRGQRLDVALSKMFPEYSRSRLQKWLTAGQITVNGEVLSSKIKVNGLEEIKIAAALPQEDQWKAQDIKLDIIYEDEALLVINKPINLVVHPAAGNWDNTLVNALLHYFPDCAKLPRAGIIHRLDKDTSGLLIVAKTLTSQTALVRELQRKEIYREYECIVQGVVTAGGTIDKPIGRDTRNRLRQTITENGKPAVTHYRVIERLAGYSHLKVVLETGRTHQIRVHLSSIGYPVVGDPLYQGRLRFPKGLSEELRSTIRDFGRQALHARKLTFTHPDTEQAMTCESPLPDDIKNLLLILKKENNVHKS